MAHEQLIKEIKGILPDDKTFEKIGSALWIVMPDKVYIDLNLATYEQSRNELEKYITQLIKI